MKAYCVCVPVCLSVGPSLWCRAGIIARTIRQSISKFRVIIFQYSLSGSSGFFAVLSSEVLFI